MKILKNLKNVLDLKNQKNKISKTNSNEITKTNSNKSINQQTLTLNLNIDDNNIKIPNIEDPISIKENNQKEEGNNLKFENNYSKNEIEYYTYNFPDIIFSDNLTKEKEYQYQINKSDKTENDNSETISLEENKSYDLSYNYNSYLRSYNEEKISSDYNPNRTKYYKEINNTYYSKDKENKELSNNINNIKYYYKRNFDSYYNITKNNVEFENSFYYAKKENYFKTKKSSNFTNSEYDNYLIEKDNFNKKYSKNDLINKICGDEYKSGKLYEIKKIINNNKKMERKIIRDLISNEIYVKNMKEEDFLMLEGKLKFDDIDRIIDKEKSKIIKKYLGKKIFFN